MTALAGRPSLDRAAVGNCQVAGLLDELGRLVWACEPLRFAGPPRELVSGGCEALIANPFDVTGTAAAIADAINMPRAERRQRMRLLRQTIKGNNLYRWAGRMLVDIARIRQRQSISASG